MTTKTMDWEEYIKKSDVKTIISRIKYIRPIQVPDEVSSAITLLKKEGYLITKI